jgi:hypothetical protein
MEENGRLEQINLMMTLYSYRHQKRANVCRFVPPLTRGGQEGFAAVKSAFLHDLLLKTPSFPPCQGGSGQTTAFGHILRLLYAMALQAMTSVIRYAHSFVNVL